MRFKPAYRILCSLLLPVTFYPAFAQVSDHRWSVRMAESAIADGGYQGVHDYVDATAMKAFRALWQATGEEKYYTYLKTAVDDDLEDYYAMAAKNYHDIDPVNGGSLILYVSAVTGDSAYGSAADSLLKFLWAFPRTSDGGFYHKDSPHMQVDDLFMGSPFLAEYGREKGLQEAYKDAARQAVLMEKHTRDTVTGLYYHVWYEEAEGQFEAGCNPITWGRGMGWVAMALVDILDFLPEDYAGRDSVTAVFQRLAQAVSRVQDETTGVWWQVLDKGGLQGNFLESSASCMFVYALAKGIRLGYLDESYREVVQKGYKGILEQFIRDNGDGTIRIISVCPGQSPSPFVQPYLNRDYENGHAVGPFILAGVEIEYNGLPPSALTAKAVSGTGVSLNWVDNSDDEDGFRLQRASEDDFEELALLPPGTRTYQDTALNPLTEYAYRVCSFRGDTNSYWSNYAWAITLGANGSPAYASRPAPADSAISVDNATTLSWIPGEASLTHEVYLGTGNPLQHVASLEDSLFIPDTLLPGTRYWWRIDEVNQAGTTTGHRWTFITADLPGLVAWWKMDEDMGTLVRDETENGNHGTLFNAGEDAWIEGISGSAIRFDGVDDYLRVPHDPSIDFGQEDFTIAFWLWQEAPQGRMTLLEKGGEDSPGKGYGFYSLPGEGGGIWGGSTFQGLPSGDFKVRFIIRDGKEDPVDMFFIPIMEFDTASWIHIAGRRMGESNVIRIYLDGEVAGLSEDNMGDISQEEDLYFGVSPGSDSSWFLGALDDVRIYNYALSDEEILSLYKEMKPGTGLSPEFSRSPGSLEVRPNPFLSLTTLTFRTDRTEKVTLRIYDLSGREVADLLDAVLPAGEHTLPWDASGLEGGTYICRLQTGSRTAALRLVRIR